jgi:hypothetical protein
LRANRIAPVDRIRQLFPPAEWFTMRRHPLPEYYDSLDALPPSLAPLAAQTLLPGEAVEGVLVVPAEYFSRKMLVWEYVPERALIFVRGSLLYVSADGPGIPAKAARIDASALLSLRSSILLLYGLLEFKADCGPAAEEVRLEYNTVVWHWLNAPLARFVEAACPARRADSDAATARAANEPLLATLPFKFANGLRYYSLAPGERLQAAVFQPAIWQKGGYLVRRQVTPNTLLALTDRKLALIEEKRAQPWSHPPGAGQGEYGWIFTYIPVDRVVEMSVAPNEGRSDLAIKLEWGAASQARVVTLDNGVAEQWLSAWEAGTERAVG